MVMHTSSSMYPKATINALLTSTLCMCREASFLPSSTEINTGAHVGKLFCTHQMLTFYFEFRDSKSEEINAYELT